MLKTYRSKEFETQLARYRKHHSTFGCKVTHMIGVPLIALSFPVGLFNKKLAFNFFVLGWILQFIGHFVFEKNRPMLMSEYRSPLTLMAALTFVVEEWIKLLDNINDEAEKAVQPLRRVI